MILVLNISLGKNVRVIIFCSEKLNESGHILMHENTF